LSCVMVLVVLVVNVLVVDVCVMVLVVDVCVRGAGGVCRWCLKYMLCIYSFLILLFKKATNVMVTCVTCLVCACLRAGGLQGLFLALAAWQQRLAAAKG
jgi:hypothetical protein